MTPFYFGTEHRRLFGVFHPGRIPATAAALLCNPWGEEAIRVHRFQRVLADRLARNGVDVLRFDYFGTGDSAGEDAEGDFSGWTADVLAAFDELMQRSAAARTVWVAARLGAAIAASATVRASRVPDRLIVWDPVLDGRRYLHELEDFHARGLDVTYAGGPRSWRELPFHDGECLGFRLGDTLRTQLVSLAPDTLPAPRTWRCHVVHGDTAGVSETAARWKRSGVDVVTVRLPGDSFDWTSTSFDAALVPAETLEVLSDLVLLG